jgi:hypothetical protein
MHPVNANKTPSFVRHLVSLTISKANREEIPIINIVLIYIN